MRVVTAPAVPAACSACSLPLRARRPRSSEDATPPLSPGLIGLGRVASFLPCVPLLRGPRTWFRVAAVVGVEGHRTRCVVRLSSCPRRPSGTASARSSRSKRPSCFVARPRPETAQVPRMGMRTKGNPMLQPQQGAEKAREK
ncbi:hypothetical protein NDU88_002600 [Pleurodeles waltl]|uniref:Uncharacterized protein n=1 Tax=Pleurodeles waltl TaxID=8319 RepID=A0AAV7NID0_PLEWA|nr:hypothetical protein NDU88_002553 [Pleurodeles waltl]KAJ1114362.1 hypothetical protein NDU88_002600 [Pleurodeles waltl]